ncbi:MAG: C40 family peptidase, partial [Syntrophales bacterium]|nr:C40 family peptidase [Syntrophales bacterium]
GGQKKSAPSADASMEVDEYEEEDGGRTGDPRGDINLTETEKDAQSNAELLGKWNNPEERKLFVKVATAFLGAPYRLGGASLRGIDCSAFVKKIYQLFDVSLPRTAKEQAHVGVRVAKDDLIEGDLVFFNTKRSFGHVGIYIGNNEFVHTSSRNKGIRIDKLDQPYFNKRFVKAIRLKGLDEEGAILGIADNVKRFN